MDDFFSLNKAKNGCLYVINDISIASFQLSRRLCDLGIIQGAKILFLKKSVLGKTYLFSVNNHTLSVREEIARMIKIKEVSNVN